MWLSDVQTVSRMMERTVKRPGACFLVGPPAGKGSTGKQRPSLEPRHRYPEHFSVAWYSLLLILSRCQGCMVSWINCIFIWFAGYMGRYIRARFTVVSYCPPVYRYVILWSVVSTGRFGVVFSSRAASSRLLEKMGFECESVIIMIVIVILIADVDS